MEPPGENETAATADNPFESAFDDEFAVHTPGPSQYEFSMADGMRDPTETRPSLCSSASAPTRPISLNAQVDSNHPPAQPSRPPVRSSIAKNPLPSDSSRGPLLNRPSRTAIDSQPRHPIDLSRRSSSRASSYAPFERSITPGLSGPSHPYDMYPQTSVPRSSSVRTTATLRHSSSTSTSVTRPAYPYALYQQNGLPVSDDDSTAPDVPPIQVGFPGRDASFHRQLGPDGEEQDIIGPDGHTEQLPPYSKYPNENEKAMTASATGIPTSSTLSRDSERVLVPSAQSPSQIPQDDTERAPSETAGSGTTTIASEKSWKEKNWKERWKTKVLCRFLPCWLLVVALGCLMFVGIVIGGAIGGFLAKEKQNQASAVATTNAASTLDASPVPTPTDVPPFPVGQFLLPIGSPYETEQSCLTDPSQTNAWSCNVPSTNLIISTGTNSGGFSIAKIYPQSPSSNGPIYQYGAQPPTVIPAEKLSYVIDLSDPRRGPALHFQTVYDKFVILDPSSLSLSRKRQGRALPHYLAPATNNGPPVPSPSDKGYPYRKSTVQSGEQPWFCFWNSTSIEGFIYVFQPSSNCSSASTTTASGITESTPPSSQLPVPSSSTSPTTPTPLAPSTILAAFTTLATPTTLATSTTLMTSTTIATSITQSTLTGTTTNGKGKDTATTHGNGKAVTKRDGDGDGDNDDNPTHDKAATNNNLSQFPYIVKLSERRLPNPSGHAYCQKMNVNNDGSVTPVLENNNPIIIKLQETDPSESQFASAAMSPVSSSVTSVPTTTAVNTGNKGYVTARDVVAVTEVEEEEEDWSMMERSIEERIAEAAVEEWERSFGPAVQPWYLGKREDPTHSCACQWLVL